MFYFKKKTTLLQQNVDKICWQKKRTSVNEIIKPQRNWQGTDSLVFRYTFLYKIGSFILTIPNIYNIIITITYN